MSRMSYTDAERAEQDRAILYGQLRELEARCARLRHAAEQARLALSTLIASRDPIVFSAALRALDEALK